MNINMYYRYESKPKAFIADCPSKFLPKYPVITSHADSPRVLIHSFNEHSILIRNQLITNNNVVKMHYIVIHLKTDSNILVDYNYVAYYLCATEIT